MPIDRDKLATELPREYQDALVRAGDERVSITGLEYNMLMHALFSTQSSLFQLMDYLAREKRGDASAHAKFEEALQSAQRSLDAAGKLNSWVLQRVGGGDV